MIDLQEDGIAVTPMRRAEADQFAAGQRSHVHIRQLLAPEPIAELVAVSILVDDEAVAVGRAAADVDRVSRRVAVMLVVDTRGGHSAMSELN
jgi:hypothetical protein